MNLESVYKYFSRTLFIIATAAIVVAFVEWTAEFFGFSLIRTYQPGRLLELAATLLVFVIAVLLRQIREELREGRSS